jgi:conjugative relaxase-like TrwC/TraI family protein
VLNISRPMSPAAVKSYFSAADYFINDHEPPGIWGGKLAAELGLAGQVEREAFHRMADGRHPYTEAKLKPGRDGERAANDITLSAPKEVTLLYVRTGDERILQAFNESCDWVMGEMEKEAATQRSNPKRWEKTGNWAWAGFVHFEARPDKQSQLPDPQLHRHHVVFNLTESGQGIRAIELGYLKGTFGKTEGNADLYMPMFHNELARRMKELGYGIERNGKVGFGITGIPRELVERFSKRRITIQKAKEAIAKAEGIKDPERLRRLQAELAVLTRKHKQKDLTHDELWKFWDSQLTKADRVALGAAKGQAGWETSSNNALRYAIDHLLERASVVPEKKVLATALNYGVGSVDLASLKAEYNNLGVLVKDGQITTREVLNQEGRIIDFAREGKGTMRPLGVVPGRLDKNATLSTEQQATLQSRTSNFTIPGSKVDNLSAEQQTLIQHVLTSTDQVMLVQGDAGTGKTTAIRSVFNQLHCPVEMLAPSASASRGVLRDEGFHKADTVASFLQSEERQRAVRNGVIWVDETSLLSINDLEALSGIAKAQHARIVLQGDPKQHRAVARDGNMMKVLEEYGDLKVGRLKEIWRQKNPAYKEAVALIAKGDILKGHEQLEKMGAIHHGAGLGGIAAEYLHCRNHGLSVLLVAPTHAVGDSLTGDIRKLLRQQGKLGDDVVVPVLKPLHWTEAQKADSGQYTGNEVIQFHRNSGACRAGERIEGTDSRFGSGLQRPEHFSVFAPSEIAIARGDTVRITNNSWDTTGLHRLDNGSHYTVASVDGQSKRITLSNGWVINTPHITHGYVSTSYGAQGKTVDVCLAAMGQDSLPAINAAQFYVTASRARHAFRLYTDLSKDELKAAIKRSDTRRSATEVFKPKKRDWKKRLAKRAREAVARRLYEQQNYVIPPEIPRHKIERNYGHER